MKYIFLTVFFFTQTFKGNCSIIDTIPQSQIRSINEHIRYIENNTDSLTSLNYLYYYRIDLPLNRLVKLYNSLSNKLKETNKGVELKNDIQWRQNLIKKVKNYTLIDTNNNKVYLTDLLKSKKLTLIDFWGSWCIPCRNDSPNLIELNNKYSKNDFRIISISEDVNIKNWLESIQTDKTNKWIHLIDTKRFIQNDLGIETIPRKILVNDKLEIIGVYTSNFYGKYNLENDLEKYKITN